jgi:hypothetical protein
MASSSERKGAKKFGFTAEEVCRLKGESYIEKRAKQICDEHCRLRRDSVSSEEAVGEDVVDKNTVIQVTCFIENLLNTSKSDSEDVELKKPENIVSDDCDNQNTKPSAERTLREQNVGELEKLVKQAQEVLARRRLSEPYCMRHSVREADPALIYLDVSETAGLNAASGDGYNTSHVIYKNVIENVYMFANGVRIPERVFSKLIELCDYLHQSRRWIYNPRKVDQRDEKSKKLAEYFGGNFIFMAGVGRDNKYRAIAFQEAMEREIYARWQRLGILMLMKTRRGCVGMLQTKNTSSASRSTVKTRQTRLKSSYSSAQETL